VKLKKKQKICLFATIEVRQGEMRPQNCTRVSHQGKERLTDRTIKKSYGKGRRAASGARRGGGRGACREEKI